MRTGFHVSIAGGLARATARAAALGCETIQLFTRSPRGWAARPLDETAAAEFRSAVQAAGIAPVFVHAPYLVNLATADAALARRSRTALVEELERARLLGAVGVVVHAGRAHDADRRRSVQRVARAVTQVLRRAQGDTMLLIENTAGARGDVGSRFEELAAILAAAGCADRLGIVLDTAHLFAAGYELRSRTGLDATMRAFDRTVGLGRLHLLHLNDSRAGLGSGLDRHWHIGRGEIGATGFREVANHPLLRHLPGMLETPRKDARDERRDLTAIRRLLN